MSKFGCLRVIEIAEVNPVMFYRRVQFLVKVVKESE